jgi:excisionase family DNA binding protein
LTTPIDDKHRPSAPDATWLTLSELAQLLNITERHVRRLVAERRIPVTRVGGQRGRLRFNLARSKPGSTTTATTPTTTAVATQPDAPRLFDLDPPDPEPSQPETATAPSRSRTVAEPSPSDTQPAPSQPRQGLWDSVVRRTFCA